MLESQEERLDLAGRRFFDRIQEVDLSTLAAAILERLRESEPERVVETRVRPGVAVAGDGQLLRIALANLLENAWKFTAREPSARIEFGMTTVAGEPTCVRPGHPSAARLTPRPAPLLVGPIAVRLARPDDPAGRPRVRLDHEAFPGALVDHHVVGRRPGRPDVSLAIGHSRPVWVNLCMPDVPGE